ncbi:T3SS effector HopA1 family protein [Streptomyces kronopolitis]
MTTRTTQQATAAHTEPPPMVLAPRLTQALTAVTVRAGARHASVAGRAVTADSPRDLRGRLSTALYEWLHAGHQQHDDDADQGEGSAPLPKRTLRDPELERRLSAAVPHHTTRARGLLRAVEGTGAGRQLLVQFPDITARVPAARLHPAGDPAPGDTVELALEAARPALSPGFFYVMGSRPLPRPLGPIRRVFLHLTDQNSATDVWATTLSVLEREGACYHAKIMSDPQGYPRRDALVAYLHGEYARSESALAHAVVGMPGLGTGTSVFTEEIAPGIAAAWDPYDPRPGQRGLSFGQHRCLALASALVEHALDGTRSCTERIAEAFRAANIDPLRPGRNLTDTPGR